MADRTLKKGDTWPPLRATLTVDGEPLDLTTADSVTMIAVGPENTLTATLTVLEPATAGRVEHEWEAGETDEVGTHTVEFKVIWSTGVEETVPNTGMRTFAIEEDLET